MTKELNIPKPDCATDGAQLEDIHNFNRHQAIYVWGKRGWERAERRREKRLQNSACIFNASAAFLAY
jgi:hypothetical protein